MTLFRLALHTAGLALAVHTASAIAFTDINDYVTAQNPDGQYVSWNVFDPFSDSFDIISDGYNPATMQVTSATVKFWFNDDDGDLWVPILGNLPDPVVIDLGALNLFDDGLLWGDLFAVDVALGTTVDGQYVGGSIIASLQDGDLSFRVHGVGADFYLTKAQLNVEATSTAVPDGGVTAAMLGLALMGTAAARRRFTR